MDAEVIDGLESLLPEHRSDADLEKAPARILMKDLEQSVLN
ncbi:hypothetical protein AAE026_31250 [Bradyrhizobium sp. DN5]